MQRFLRLLLLFFLTYQHIQATGASASSLLSPKAVQNCVNACTKRTLFGIIWGCVSTTFICTWTAVHPNIPPRESFLKRALRRISLMFWAVVTPEILPCWAFNQVLAAKTVRDVYNKGKGYKKEAIGITRQWFSLYEFPHDNSRAWTLKHGHFLIMGGIHLVEPVEASFTQQYAEKGTTTSMNRLDPEETPRGRVTILTLEMLGELIKDPDFKIQITEDEITDRSKGNAISKTVYMFQTTWFIIQCIARIIQGLPLTQLELTTLALSSLNGFTLFLWWDKPLGVETPIYVEINRKLTDAERNIAGRTNSLRAQLMGLVQDFLKRLPPYIRDIIHCQSHKNPFVAALRLILYPFEFVISLILSPIIIFGVSIYAYLIDLWLGGSSSFLVDATHVPTYYVPLHGHYSPLYFFLLMVPGFIFGGIHCAGWQFPLPTPVEQQLWRVASLAITTLPVGSVMAATIVGCDILEWIGMEDLDFSSLAFPFIVVVIYGVARFVLLGQALALLRNLPPEAFVAVDWNKFYPHFL